MRGLRSGCGAKLTLFVGNPALKGHDEILKGHDFNILSRSVPKWPNPASSPWFSADLPGHYTRLGELDLRQPAHIATTVSYRTSIPAAACRARLRNRASVRLACARQLGLALAVPLLLFLAGCGVSAGPTKTSSQSVLSITPGVSRLDTNCTGCNAVNARSAAVQHFNAVLANGAPAAVAWSVAGGDPSAGPGSIDANGRYTPPTYLSVDQALVVVSARLISNYHIQASAPITLTPGFLQPLTPENVALGPGASVTLTGRLAQSGGRAGIQFEIAESPQGGSAGQGTLSEPVCHHARQAFTTCSVTYTAPVTLSATAVAYVVAQASGSRTDAEVLLNPAGVTSNPATHQGQMATMMPLGSSGGNNNDFDARGNSIADCCSGTLGALLQDNSGGQFLLSNNHVLARSDHATIGDPIVQPGLIDNNCTPNGDGPGTVPVATLSAWLPLNSAETNADAAIAQVGSRTVDNGGAILELGARQADGTLAAAPPGISSTSGRGESATLAMKVAKSGRTTGLTCGRVSVIDLDVSVDYYRDCAETRPYLTKLFTHQIAISGDRFTDSGDSGALVVDATNAEPVGLFFAGGADTAGVVHAVANPAPDVLRELDAEADNRTSFTFAGGADHPVSCLNYGNTTVAAAQSAVLSDAEIGRAQQALSSARSLVNPSAGILGVAMGKSSDHPGEAAVLVYVAAGSHANVSAALDGVRTNVIAATPEAVSLGAAPLSNQIPETFSLSPVALAHALQIKNQIAHAMMGRNPAFFAVGVGLSFDNPREAALVVYVDRTRLPTALPAEIDGLRTRYIEMDRLHVTRSYLQAGGASQHCMPHAVGAGPQELLNLHRRESLLPTR
jgi:hypothetical protein